MKQKFQLLFLGLLFTTFFSTTNFAQANLQITQVDCPQDFPRSFGMLTFSTTITNTGNVASSPQALYLYQGQAVNGPANVSFGSVTIPAIAPGASITPNLEYDMNSGLAFPGIYFGASGGNAFNYTVGNFFLSFDQSQFPAIEAEIDFYCKKYETDLKIEVQAQSPYFNEDGIITYAVKITNTGPEDAYNITAKLLGPVALANPDLSAIYEVFDMPPYSPVRVTIDGFVQWNIRALGAGRSISNLVTFKILGDGQITSLPDEYTMETSVTSGHLIDTNTDNNESSFTFTSNPNPPSCPEEIAGFTLLGEYNGHQYFLSDDLRNWNNAQTKAEEQGAYLATIDDAAENDFIQSVLSEIAFIGLSDQATEGDFQWSDGTPLGYTNYNTDCIWCGVNSPSNDFVNFFPWNGTWGFDNQWVARKYLLEVECEAANSTDLRLGVIENSNNAFDRYIFVTNEGDNIATNVVVSRENRAGSIVFSSHTLGFDQGFTTDDTWYVGTLHPGQSAFWYFDYYIVDQYTTGYLYFQVLSADQDDPDSTPNSDLVFPQNPDEDDEDRILVSGSGGSLPGAPGINITADVTTAAIGDLVTFTIDLDNSPAGQHQPSSNLPYVEEYVANFIPDGLSFVSAEVSTGNYDPITEEWYIPYLAERTLPATNVYFTSATMEIVLEVTEENVPLTYTVNTNTFIDFYNDEASVTINSTIPNCPDAIDGFTLLGEYNDHQYFISNEKQNWGNANNQVAQLDADLVAIDDAAENAFLQSQISEIVFIGLNDLATEGNLEWSNGQPLAYTNLNVGCQWCGVNDAQKDFATLLPWDGTWGFDNQWVARKYIIEVVCATSSANPNASLAQREMEGEQYRKLHIQNVSPVPATDFVRIQLYSQERMSTSATIYDALGTPIQQLFLDLKKGQNTVQIDLNTLYNGLHYVLFDINERHDPIKFIKIKED